MTETSELNASNQVSSSELANCDLPVDPRREWTAPGFPCSNAPRGGPRVLHGLRRGSGTLTGTIEIRA